MKRLQEPELIKIDIGLIRFNPKNPNRHAGSAFAELVKSIEKNGIFNPPTVRALPGGLYETIAGEGRVKATLQLFDEGKISDGEIFVLSRGIVDDETTMLFMHVDNAVRNLDFISECVGLAQLNKNGVPVAELVKEFSPDNLKSRRIWDQIGIGNFAPDIIEMIQNDIAENSKKEFWNITFLRELLRLRIETKHHTLTESQVSEYDYKEVRVAVKKAISGDIKDSTQLSRYITNRQKQNFERIVNVKVQTAINEELELAKKQLESDYQDKIAGLEEKQKKEHIQKVEALQKQIEEFQNEKDDLIRQLSKRPDKLEEKEKALFETAGKLRTVRLEYEEFKRNQEFQIETITARIKREQETLYNQKLQEKQEEFEKELQLHKRNMEEYYQEKDNKRQLKATASFQSTVARYIGLLSETHQLGLMQLAPGFEEGFEWLTPSEILAWSAQIVTTNETNEKIQRRLHEVAEMKGVVNDGRKARA